MGWRLAMPTDLTTSKVPATVLTNGPTVRSLEPDPCGSWQGV